MSQDQILAAFSAEVEGLPNEDRSPLFWQGHVVRFFLARLDEYVHSLGGIDAVITLAQKAYRQYVAPLDLPGVPNIVEPSVDAAAEHFVGIFLRAAHDRLHQE